MKDRPAAAPPDYPSDHLLTVSHRMQVVSNRMLLFYLRAGNVEGPSVKRFLQQELLIPTVSVR